MAASQTEGALNGHDQMRGIFDMDDRTYRLPDM